MSIKRHFSFYVAECDYCGKRLMGGYRFNEAVQVKRDSRWASRKVFGNWKDICDECQFEERGYGKRRVPKTG